MHVLVNGVRLFFDVEGPGLVPSGPGMRERPTIILLHGAPGLTDHSMFKPQFSRLADVAQLVYLDLRAAGRSESGPANSWTLEQWADDLVAFCDALSIVRPVVLGVSGGGFVAMAYASRHPTHPRAIILASTQARLDHARSIDAFARLGGPEAEKAAADFLTAPLDIGNAARYGEVCLPLYNPTPPDPEQRQRCIFRQDLFAAFHAYPDGTWHTFDLRNQLHKIQCPTLIMVGDADPITAPADSLDIAAAMDHSIVRLERFPACGHGVWRDDPERSFAVIRDFVVEVHAGV